MSALIIGLLVGTVIAVSLKLIISLFSVFWFGNDYAVGVVTIVIVVVALVHAVM